MILFLKKIRIEVYFDYGQNLFNFDVGPASSVFKYFLFARLLFNYLFKLLNLKFKFANVNKNIGNTLCTSYLGNVRLFSNFIKKKKTYNAIILIIFIFFCNERVLQSFAMFAMFAIYMYHVRKPTMGFTYREKHLCNFK